MSDVRLTAGERDEIAGHCFNVWADTDDNTSDNDAYDRFRAEVVPWVEAIIAAHLAQALPLAPDVVGEDGGPDGPRERPQQPQPVSVDVEPDAVA